MGYQEAEARRRAARKLRRRQRPKRAPLPPLRGYPGGRHGLSYYLIIRHAFAGQAKETAVGPASIKGIRALRREHRAEIHRNMHCYLSVEVR